MKPWIILRGKGIQVDPEEAAALDKLGMQRRTHIDLHCYLLLATCYLLLATCYLLLATCYLLLATCYMLLANTHTHRYWLVLPGQRLGRFEVLQGVVACLH